MAFPAREIVIIAASPVAIAASALGIMQGETGIGLCIFRLCHRHVLHCYCLDTVGCGGKRRKRGACSEESAGNAGPLQPGLNLAFHHGDDRENVLFLIFCFGKDLSGNIDKPIFFTPPFLADNRTFSRMLCTGIYRYGIRVDHPGSCGDYTLKQTTGYGHPGTWY